MGQRQICESYEQCRHEKSSASMKRHHEMTRQVGSEMSQAPVGKLAAGVARRDTSVTKAGAACAPLRSTQPLVLPLASAATSGEEYHARVCEEFTTTHLYTHKDTAQT